MAPRPLKRTWGGKRPGAGRPVTRPGSRKAMFLLDERTDRLIAERAAAEGVSRSEALARCLREWAAARSSGPAGHSDGAAHSEP